MPSSTSRPRSAGERNLTSPEWSEIAHRLARTVHLHIPGEEDGCRWVAVQARPRRLDILANLIRQDGTWQRQPHDLARRLAAESRRIETELQLTRHHQHHHSAHRLAAPALAPDLPSAAPQIAALLTQLAEENEGALATARGFVEHAAHRLESLPEPAGADVAHRLKWIARRIHGIQQDIDAAATHLAHDRRTPFASPHGLHTTPPPLHAPHRTRPAP
ncbi:hypothetical protein [Streptomyces albus]|uniref:hypothetical protein n=1 Tax=Streptomyces albus TaxID=1888 RepID=UPI003F199D6B